MQNETTVGQPTPSEAWTRAHEAELRVLAAKPGKRVEAAVAGGRRVWVKRFAAEGTAWPKRLHARFSPLLPAPLRASPAGDAAGMAAREMRKAQAFRTAGFPAPETLWREGNVLVLSDMGPSLKGKLAALGKSDPAAQAALIVACARALGRLHAAGLCHGRPHPRDMCRDEDERIGFFDFEEEPEAAMPLAAAQARDLWLFFVHTVLLPARAGTLEAALGAYGAEAPADVLPELKPLLRLFRPAAVLSAILPRTLVRHDYQRIVAASNFFRAAL